MATTATVEDVVRRALAEVAVPDVEVLDVEVKASLVRVVLDRPEGVDLELLTLANRIVSEALDVHDPIPGRYTLEVSSPGLERLLRTPAHFARYLGTQISVKTCPGVTGERRVRGELTDADASGITVALGGGRSRQLAYADIDKARTVFEWGSPPNPEQRSGSNAK